MKTFLLLLLAWLTLAGCTRSGPVQKDEPAPKEGFLDVPGGPIWYRVAGTGSGTPLLLIHGGPGGRSCRLSALAALGDERPIVFYDQLGSGRSGRPADPDLWQINRFVDELDAVRTRLGLTRVHILGHSWGGSLAVQYVLTKGARGVESLTLAGPLLSTRDWIEDANVLRRQLPQSVQDVLKRHEDAGTTNSAEYKEAAEAFYRQFLFHRQPVPETPECSGSAKNDVIYETMWGPTEFYATGSLKSFDVTDRLGELRMPVLFIVGRYDEARSQTVARYQQLIAGSQLQIIEEAGHMSMVDEPQKFLQVVREFLAKVDAD
jgi:proline iminopeptidase